MKLFGGLTIEPLARAGHEQDRCSLHRLKSRERMRESEQEDCSLTDSSLACGGGSSSRPAAPSPARIFPGHLLPLQEGKEENTWCMVTRMRSSKGKKLVEDEKKIPPPSGDVTVAFSSI